MASVELFSNDDYKNFFFQPTINLDKNLKV